jgi:hypothetical protein
MSYGQACGRHGDLLTIGGDVAAVTLREQGDRAAATRAYAAKPHLRNRTSGWPNAGLPGAAARRGFFLQAPPGDQSPLPCKTLALAKRAAVLQQSGNGNQPSGDEATR